MAVILNSTERKSDKGTMSPITISYLPTVQVFCVLTLITRQVLINYDNSPPGHVLTTTAYFLQASDYMCEKQSSNDYIELLHSAWQVECIQKCLWNGYVPFFVTQGTSHLFTNYLSPFFFYFPRVHLFIRLYVQWKKKKQWEKSIFNCTSVRGIVVEWLRA